ncbi:MAG: DUF4870 domain-containing protein [Terrimicrobiaceae bacterium]
METPPPTPPSEPSQPAPELPTPPSSPADRQWAAILHLSALVGFIIPFGNILGPLVVWLVKKTEMPAIDPVGKAVMNFQISWTIWMVASAVVAFVGSCLVIPLVLPLIVGIALLVLTIIGGIKASNGETYRHPLTIDFLK